MTDTEKAALERRIYDRCLVRVGQLEAEKAALERRIDELCQENERLRREKPRTMLSVTARHVAELQAEVERLHADQAHWELGNCPSCPNIADLQEALEQNTKLRELVQGLWFAAQYLGMNPDGATGSGFARQMRELGVEV